MNISWVKEKRRETKKFGETFGARCEGELILRTILLHMHATQTRTHMVKLHKRKVSVFLFVHVSLEMTGLECLMCLIQK